MKVNVTVYGLNEKATFEVNAKVVRGDEIIVSKPEASRIALLLAYWNMNGANGNCYGFNDFMMNDKPAAICWPKNGYACGNCARSPYTLVNNVSENERFVQFEKI